MNGLALAHAGNTELFEEAFRCREASLHALQGEVAIIREEACEGSAMQSVEADRLLSDNTAFLLGILEDELVQAVKAILFLHVAERADNPCVGEVAHAERAREQIGYASTTNLSSTVNPMLVRINMHVIFPVEGSLGFVMVKDEDGLVEL